MDARRAPRNANYVILKNTFAKHHSTRVAEWAHLLDNCRIFSAVPSRFALDLLFPINSPKRSLSVHEVLRRVSRSYLN